MKLSPALKLTLWYLGFIMLLSLLFTTFVYRVTMTELERGFRRPTTDRQFFLFNGFDNYEDLRLQRLHEGESNLRINLFMFNAVVLVVGGGLSYWFARRTIRPIEDALETQKRFTADASHELRTPLSVMQTEIEVALRDKDLTAQDSRDQLKSNLEEVVRMRSLVDGLLRLARNGSAIELTEMVDMRDILLSAIARVEKTSRAKKIVIDQKLKTVKLQGDRENLIELAVILLDNAIKYSPRGSTVHLKLTGNTKDAKLVVQDQGIGISPDEIHHIFERFYRADTSRSKQHVEGFGIGLSIAEQIALAHQGQIEVESTVSKGSTFTVRLPITKAPSVS